MYVVVVMFNTWKVSSCQRQERLFAGGKWITTRGWIFLDSKSGTEGYTSYSFQFFALLLILNRFVRFNLLTPEEQYKPDLTITS